MRGTTIAKQIKFEETLGELEAKNCSQRQTRTKYLRETVVFM